MNKKQVSLLHQVFIYSVVMLVSYLLTRILPIQIPSSIIGMVLLFTLLCAGVVKLEDVEEVSDFLSEHLTFFLVPSGISVINSIDVMRAAFLPIMIVILVGTFVLLLATGKSASLALTVSEFIKDHAFTLKPSSFKTQRGSKH